MDGLIRQGDILLVPVDKDTLRGKKRNARVKVDPDEGIIVAAGEATGHHHRVRTEGAKQYRNLGTTYVHFPDEGGELTHEEHETLEVPPGLYEVQHQREYAAQAAPVRVYD